ncbi:MAG: sigma 54-interacting transcriptional regulator [Planctomycetota bacterium]
MTRFDFRRKAVLARIHNTLDRFYMRQEIDWDYDIRKILDRILELGMKELEFGEGKAIDRALVIVRRTGGEELEVGAGWKIDGEEEDLAFSRTIVVKTLQAGAAVLCENACLDPRFESAESIKELEILSLVSVPIRAESHTLGAIYVERRDAGYLFTGADREFLEEFAATIAPYVKTALIHQKHVAEIRALPAAGERGAAMPHLLGRSRAMQEVIELARIAAGGDRTILITGESGSGKELLARAIHTGSRRAEGPFVIVDCSALSETLLESELFGHVRGAFTGAVTDKAGAFEEANGGTLFLDEIVDASKAMQQQLRRVLQEGEIRRVGDSALRKVDVRVICATNRDLPREVEEGRFIHDLYHRIHQFPVRLPPLRDRKEDIPMLVEHFIASSGGRKNPPVRGIEAEALGLLVGRDWRANNVRELKNVVDLAVDLCGRERIDGAAIRRTLEIREEVEPGEAAAAAAAPAALPHGECLILDGASARRIFESTSASARKEERPYYRLQREFSGKLIVECLRYNRWKLRPAARLLGISPVKLRQDFREYLKDLIAGAGEDPAARIAALLDMPEEKLRRKLADLKLTDLGIPAPSGDEDPGREGAA